MKLLPTWPGAALRLLLFLVLPVLVAWWLMIRMPGKSFQGAPPPLSADEIVLREEMRRDVEKLANEIGERNLPHLDRLQAAADFIDNSLAEAGLQPQRDHYEALGRPCDNIIAEVPGATPETLVIGAHYDTVPGSPGANDNGSGVAALLALARRFAHAPTARTLRFAAFTNEETATFRTELMGSLVYARRCRARGDRITGMISLETIGYYSQAPKSQSFPIGGLGLLYPTTGNFVAFVGNISSRRLVRQLLGGFRRHATLPSEGAALPGMIPGIGWSDHWAFWQAGYPAIMITDTAPFRYPHYHEPTDTPDKIDFDSIARLVSALQKTIAEMGNAGG